MQPSNSINRRAFLKLSSFTSAALTIGFYFPALATEDATIVTAATADNLGISLNAFISIDKTGKVSLVNHRAEMGQGAFQAVPQMIAEELEVSLDHVSIVFGPGHQSKYGGSQITGGSSAVRGAYKHLLRTGATAREMLIEAAAKKWSVPKEECYALNGEVIHRPSNKKLGYGELVEEAAKLTPPKKVALKARKDYTIIGKP